MKIEEYQKLASLLNEARKILCENEKNPRWKYSSKPYFKHWKRVTDAVDIARSESEELMFIDCPEQATIYIFYPSSDTRLNAHGRVGDKTHGS